MKLSLRKGIDPGGILVLNSLEECNSSIGKRDQLEEVWAITTLLAGTKLYRMK